MSKVVSKSWFNVKNVQNNIKKCVDFSSVKWTKVCNEVLYSNHDPADVIKAKDQELERWKQYDVFADMRKETDKIGVLSLP